MGRSQTDSRPESRPLYSGLTICGGWRGVNGVHFNKKAGSIGAGWEYWF
jgi:hypothetical protein